MPRKPKEPPKPLPFGLRENIPVKITKKNEFRDPQVGIVEGWCPKKDNGIYVWIVHTGKIAKYVCIQVDQGDTIISLAKGTDE